MDYIITDRDREHCKDCIYYYYIECSNIDANGICKIRNINVREEINDTEGV